MNGRRGEDRLYPVILMMALAALVALGLLGVPALLVAAIGAVVAALGFTVFHRYFERSEARPAPRRRVPDRYVPSVLEQSSTRRRGFLHLRRDRHASSPLRFR
jgi:hypothetical protein